MFEDENNAFDMTELLNVIEDAYDTFTKIKIKHILCDPKSFIEFYNVISSKLYETVRSVPNPIARDAIQKVNTIMQLDKLIWLMVDAQYKDLSNEDKRSIYKYTLEAFNNFETNKRRH